MILPEQSNVRLAIGRVGIGLCGYAVEQIGGYGSIRICGHAGRIGKTAMRSGIWPWVEGRGKREKVIPQPSVETNKKNDNIVIRRTVLGNNPDLQV